MGIDELCGDGEAEPGAVFSRHALEGLEQMRLRPLRHAGTGITNLDQSDRPLAPSADEDLPVRAAEALQRLQGVAAEIAQHAIKLIAVAIDLQFRINLDDPGDSLRLRQAEAVSKSMAGEPPAADQMSPDYQ